MGQLLETADDVIQELLRQRAQAKAHGDVVTTSVISRAIETVRRRMRPKVLQPAAIDAAIHRKETP